MAGKAAATVGSMHVCPLTTGTVPHVGGPISGPGVPTVLIDGQPAAVVGDMCVCCGPPDAILQGAAGVLIDGKPLALMGSMTAHAGQVTQGIPTVTIGPADPPSAAKSIASIQSNSLLEIDEMEYEEAILEPPIFTGLQTDPMLEDRGKDVEVSEEVTLVSTFALERTEDLAEDIGEALFLITMIKVFGIDVPIDDYAKLYDELSHKTISNAEIEVVQNLIPKIAWYEAPKPLNNDGSEERSKILGMSVGKKKPKPASMGRNKIFVSEGFIRRAVEDNDARGELMVALIEEFGHYLDYNLRYEIGSQGGDAPKDEGAKFAYYMLAINFLEEKELKFATATVDGAKHELIVDFSKLQQDLKEHVNAAQQEDHDHTKEGESFKAGKIKAKAGKFGHEDIIDELEKQKIFTPEQIPFIYYGNWLRDYSQLLTPLTVGFDKDKFGHIKKNIRRKDPEGHLVVSLGAMNSIKPSRYWWTFLVEILASNTFVKKEIDGGTGTLKISNNTQLMDKFQKLASGSSEFQSDPEKMYGYVFSLAKQALAYASFREHFGPLTTEVLGLYRPEEHIDNPLGLENGSVIDTEFYKEPLPHHLGIAPVYGTKHYIRNSKGKEKDFPTAVEYMCDELRKGAEKGMNPDVMRHLGQALHVLEDYFAHSNFVELCLMKYSDPKVYPWVEGKPEVVLENRTTFFDKADRTYHAPYIDKAECNKLVGKYRSFQEVIALYPGMRRVDYIQDDVFFEYGGTTFQFKQPQYGGRGPLYQNVEAHVNAYAHIRKIPVTTGTFSGWDTAASLTDVLAEKVLKPKFHFYGNVGKGEIVLDLVDLLVLTLFNEFKLRQGADPTKKDEKLLGRSISDWMKYYKHFISIRTILLTYAKVDWQREVVETFIHMGMECVFYVVKLALFLPVESIDTFIKEGQALGSHLDQDLGSDPSHTQLAKDEPDHPLNDLAGTLAKEAVVNVGQLMYDIWTANTPQVKNDKTKEMLSLAEEYFSHPVHVDWMEKTVREWAANNKEKVKEAHSKGVLAGHWQHGQEVLEEMRKEIEYVKKYWTEENQDRYPGQTHLKYWGINMEGIGASKS